MPKINPVLAEGQQAYIDGKGVADCPYRNEPNKGDWQRGWKKRQEMYRVARAEGKPLPTVVSVGGRPKGHRPAAKERRCDSCQYWKPFADRGICTGVGPVDARTNMAWANSERTIGAAVWPATMADDGCRLHKFIAVKAE